MDDEFRAYPWVSAPDDRFTLALVLDVGEVLVRHGYPAPSGTVLVALTSALFRALHAVRSSGGSRRFPSPQPGR